MKEVFEKKEGFEKEINLPAILEPVWVQRNNVPHFKGLIILYWNLDRPQAWQNFYYWPRPLEKGYFTP